MSDLYRRLHSDREVVLVGGDEAGRSSVLQALIQAARHFSALTWTQEALEGTAGDTLSALALLHAEGLERSLADWIEAAHAHVGSVREAVLDPEAFSLWLCGLEELDAQLAASGMSAPLLAHLVQRQTEELWSRIDQEIPMEVLLAGNLERVASAVWAWVEGECAAEACLETFRAVRAALLEQQEAYEQTYVMEGEWTVEVAMADRLLCEGVEGWLHGLERLESRLSRGARDLEDDLSLLMDANRRLIYLERLVALISSPDMVW